MQGRTTPTSLIGRDRELEDVLGALSEHRVVVLRGPPGVGKTRLAAEVAARQAEADDVPYLACDVTGAATVAELCTLVARQLDLEPGSEVVDPERLGLSLAERGPLLIVLDNFDAPPAVVSESLAQWSTLAPEASWLVTARARLPLGAEADIELKPLSRTDAMALFRDRAERAAPDLATRHEPSEHLERLLEELDRLPLAIELCASRAGVLSPQQLLRELELGRELLSSPTQTAFGELRGLDEAIESSWAALSPRERKVLEHCAVFVAPFSVQALAAVLGEEQHDGGPLADVVQHLVDRSLLVPVEAEGDSGRRFRVLHCISDSAQRRLARSGKWSSACRNHADYFLALGRRSSRRAIARQDMAARRSLEQIHEELLAIHRRALRGDGGLSSEAALSAALALVPWFRRVGPFSVLLDLLDRALRANPKDIEPSLHCNVVGARGSTLRLMGRVNEARIDLKKAAKMVEGLEIPLLGALLASELAQLDLEQGDHVAARQGMESVLAQYRTLQQRVLSGHALMMLGGMCYFVDDLDGAQRYYAQALAVHREVDDRIYECEALRGLALVELERGRRGSARAHFEQALAAIERVNERRWRAPTLGYFAILEQEEGDHRRAISLYAEAIAEAKWVGSWRLAAVFRGYRGTCLLEQGALAEARVELQRAIDDLGIFERMALRALFRSCLAVVDAESGDVAGAEHELELARKELADSPEQVFLSRAVDVHAGHVHLARARLAERAGQSAEASQLVARARACLQVEGFAQSDVRFAQRILERALAGQMSPGGVPVWKVHDGGLWFESPYGARVELGRKHALRRLLVRLAEERHGGSNAALSAKELISAGWPGERIQPHAARNRLRVALHTLRRLGLGDLLLTHADGYHLDPRAPVTIVGDESAAT